MKTFNIHEIFPLHKKFRKVLWVISIVFIFKSVIMSPVYKIPLLLIKPRCCLYTSGLYICIKHVRQMKS